MRGIESNGIGARFVPPLQGERLTGFSFLGLRAARSTPGYHIAGFQPADPASTGPKARNVIPDAKRTTGRNSFLSGLKARNVIAQAGASPTSAGLGNRPAIISQGLKGRDHHPN